MQSRNQLSHDSEKGAAGSCHYSLTLTTIVSINALFRVFAATIKLWVGSDNLLQCAVPSRYHFSTARALYYNVRRRFGTARALYNNARYRLGTASAPLGPSITMCGTDTPFAFYKVLIGSE